MPKLTWNVWYRSEGARRWMDATTFGSTPFTKIFYDAMRLVFYDEAGRPGLLPRGLVGDAADRIVEANGRRSGFTAADQLRMLRQGDFKYNDSALIDDERLEFQGPDADDLTNSRQRGETDVGGDIIELHFYNLLSQALTGTASFVGPVPQTADGERLLSYTVGATILHEVMHDHGFTHPDDVASNTGDLGSDYASSLPAVARKAVLEAAKVDLGPSPTAALIPDDVFTALPAAVWSAWEDDGRPTPGANGYAALVSRDPSVLNLYAVGDDGHLWQRAYFDAAWHEWGRHDDADGVTVGLGLGLTACSFAADQECVFARRGDTLWQREWTAQGGWTGWSDIGAPPPGLASPPTSVARDVGTINVYVRGGDHALWQNAFYDGAWHGWGRHDDSPTMTGPPAVAALSATNENVFVAGSDGNLWHKFWNADRGWSPWQSRGAPPPGLLSPPTAVSRGEQCLNVYAVGQDSTLWQLAYTWHMGWYAWTQHADPDDPGFGIWGPRSAHMGQDSEQISVVGSDGRLHRKTWSG